MGIYVAIQAFCNYINTLTNAVTENLNNVNIYK